jgi:hypothetical protein
MRSRLVPAALTAVLATTLTATPTWAEAPRRAPLVDAVDTAHDVTLTDYAGPTVAQRRSVDLLGLKVVTRGDRVRLAFRIARVTSSPDFDQLLTVRFLDADPESPDVSGEITLRVQHTRSGRADATVEDENGGSGTGCFLIPVVVAKAAGRVKIDVDPFCLPPGELGITAKSFTTTPKGERRTIYSRDFLRVPGSYDLGGAAGADLT